MTRYDILKLEQFIEKYYGTMMLVFAVLELTLLALILGALHHA